MLHPAAIPTAYREVVVLHYYADLPVADENPYSVGSFATGNKQRGIRNYGMNQSPLNFSDLGYDPFFTAGESPLHADGEISGHGDVPCREVG